MIQEPWINRGQIKGLSSKLSKVVYDNRQESPRACILIRNDINYICVTEFMSRDLTPIVVQLDIGGCNRNIVIASAYFPGDGLTTPPPEVQELIQYCRRERLPLLLGCDANAHHVIWGSTDINYRGECLLEFLMTTDLEVLNVGTTPTFVTRTRSEVLDITLVSSSIRDLIKNWRVSTEPSLSDHRIIELNIENVKYNRPIRRVPRKTNWEVYKTNLQNNLHCLSSGGNRHHMDLEQDTEKVTKAIMEAFESSCPVTTERSKKDAPWWNRHLSKMRSQVRHLFNTAKNDGNWQGYTEVLTLYNKEIRKARRQHFRTFCEEIADTPTAARLHKAMAKGGTNPVMALKKPDGTYTKGEEEQAILLLQTHFPGSVPVEITTVVDTSKPKKEDWEAAKRVFTAERMKWAISTFQPFKSPGVDGIFPALLQKGQKEIFPHLLRIARTSLASGYIPSIWRRAKVTFIPKIGKKDGTNPKSFRPISLTSFVLKTIEKAVDNYIRKEILEKAPLHPCQHAYRAGRSTETALYQLTEIIQKTLKEKETAICAFLDISGAFDNTSHGAVKIALERRGVNKTIVRWVCEMLTTRTAETTVGEQTTSIRTTRGTPQGGVTSPLLWSLVVDELLTRLTNQGLTCIGYADDIVIIAKGKFEGTLYDLIQKGLSTTEEWCTSVGLSINSAKTIIVPFTRRRKIQLTREIHLSGEIVNQANEVKYLGVTLDSKLLWKKHLEAIINKATKAIMVCRNLAGKNWGCTPKILRWMYIMMVKPIITYGAAVWYGIAEQSTTRRALDKLQRLASVCITGAMRTCPTAALNVILDLTPLHLSVKGAAERAMFRLARNRTEAKDIIDQGAWSSQTRCIPLFDLPKDDITKEYHFERNFLTRIDNKSDWESGKITESLKENTIKWYTDGSKTDKGSGAGVFGPRTKYFESLGKYTSVFQAEIHAIDRCAQMILNRNYLKQDIAIFTDSQSAIMALSSYAISSKIVRDCLGKLNEVGKKNKVTLLWVPGHTGVEGNEEANTLAKKGSGSPFIGPEPFCGIGKNTYIAELKKMEDDLRARLWDDLPGLRHSKIFLGNFNPKNSKALVNLSKTKLRILTGFMTGHCHLREHRRKLLLERSSECRFCGEEEETPEHLLTVCEAVARSRATHLGDYVVLEGDIPSLTPYQLLSFIKAIGLDEVL